MNLRQTLFVSLFFIATGFAQQTASDVVNTVRNRYKAESVQIEAAEAAAKTQFAAAYAKELGRAKDAAQANGDLDGVLQINNLITDANAGTVKTPPNTASAMLRAAYTNYDRNVSAALRPFSSRRQQLDTNISRDLATLEQQYTRSGQIEAAKLAREARIVVANTIGVAKANNPFYGDSVVISNMTGAALKLGDRLISEKSFKPPVEVEWRIQTDGDVRFSYACSELIFNWGKPPHELRIDGGPADGQHKPNAGAAPTNRIISVKLNVQPTEMFVTVDGRERARWKADFSTINQPVGIAAVAESTIKVEQVIVRKLR